MDPRGLCPPLSARDVVHEPVGRGRGRTSHRGEWTSFVAGVVPHALQQRGGEGTAPMQGVWAGGCRGCPAKADGAMGCASRGVWAPRDRLLPCGPRPVLVHM